MKPPIIDAGKAENAWVALGGHGASIMNEIAERVKTQALALSPEEREEIAMSLLGSLDNGSCEDADPELLAELDRRMAELDNGTVVGVPAEQVFEKLRNKYG